RTTSRAGGSSERKTPETRSDAPGLGGERDPLGYFFGVTWIEVTTLSAPISSKLALTVAPGLRAFLSTLAVGGMVSVVPSSSVTARPLGSTLWIWPSTFPPHATPPRTSTATRVSTHIAKTGFNMLWTSYVGIDCRLVTPLATLVPEASSVSHRPAVGNPRLGQDSPSAAPAVSVSRLPGTP